MFDGTAAANRTRLTPFLEALMNRLLAWQR
jgi:hypothetical protein